MGKKIKRKIPRRRGVTSTEKGPTISKKGVKKVEISENFILQNKENILFCGSYFGYGFHEDGIKSTIDMLKHLND